MLSLRHTKQTSKNVADTTFKDWDFKILKMPKTSNSNSLFKWLKLAKNFESEFILRWEDERHFDLSSTSRLEK